MGVLDEIIAENKAAASQADLDRRIGEEVANRLADREGAARRDRELRERYLEAKAEVARLRELGIDVLEGGEDDDDAG